MGSRAGGLCSLESWFNHDLKWSWSNSSHLEATTTAFTCHLFIINANSSLDAWDKWNKNPRHWEKLFFFGLVQRSASELYKLPTHSASSGSRNFQMVPCSKWNKAFKLLCSLMNASYALFCFFLFSDSAVHFPSQTIHLWPLGKQPFTIISYPLDISQHLLLMNVLFEQVLNYVLDFLPKLNVLPRPAGLGDLTKKFSLPQQWRCWS